MKSLLSVLTAIVLHLVLTTAVALVVGYTEYRLLEPLFGLVPASANAWMTDTGVDWWVSILTITFILVSSIMLGRLASFHLIDKIVLPWLRRDKV